MFFESRIIGAKINVRGREIKVMPQKNVEI
jgi:hypothetical protein